MFNDFPDITPDILGSATSFFGGFGKYIVIPLAIVIVFLILYNIVDLMTGRGAHNDDYDEEEE